MQHVRVRARCRFASEGVVGWGDARSTCQRRPYHRSQKRGWTPRVHCLGVSNGPCAVTHGFFSTSISCSMRWPTSIFEDPEEVDHLRCSAVLASAAPRPLSRRLLFAARHTPLNGRRLAPGWAAPPPRPTTSCYGRSWATPSEMYLFSVHSLGALRCIQHSSLSVLVEVGAGYIRLLWAALLARTCRAPLRSV